MLTPAYPDLKPIKYICSIIKIDVYANGRQFTLKIMDDHESHIYGSQTRYDKSFDRFHD